MQDPKEVPPPYDEIVHRLVSGTERKIVFLLGAPLTAPKAPDCPGVPGTSGIIGMMRDRLPPSAQAKLDDLQHHPAENRYQKAFEIYLRFVGQDRVNELIRSAVLKSRYNTELPFHDVPTLEFLEKDVNGWHVTMACKRLAQLLLRRSHRFDPVVLTTNFDPLIEVAILKEGGLFAHSILHGDGNINVVHGPVPHVVHLHGFWHGSDTLHTLAQLTQTRPLLQRSIGQLIAGKTLVVAAYGGWDDVATRAIAEVAKDVDVDVLWTFHSGDSVGALKGSSVTVRNLLEIRPGRVTPYFGIDVHELMNWLYWTTGTEEQIEDFHFWNLARLYLQKALGCAPANIFDRLNAISTQPMSVDQHIEKSLHLTPVTLDALIDGISGSDERRARIALRTLRERNEAIKEEPDFDPDEWDLGLNRLTESSAEPAAARSGAPPERERTASVSHAKDESCPPENAYHLGSFFITWIQFVGMFSDNNLLDDSTFRNIQKLANTLNHHCLALGIPRRFAVPETRQRAEQEIENGPRAFDSLCASIRKRLGYQIEQWCLLGYASAYHKMTDDLEVNVSGGEMARTEMRTEAEADVRRHAANLRLTADLIEQVLAGHGEGVFQDVWHGTGAAPCLEEPTP